MRDGAIRWGILGAGWAAGTVGADIRASAGSVVVFRTLAYVDGVHHAVRASAPALFSVGLRDDVCPPSTVFAAYHAYSGPAQMAVYEFNGHEAGLGPHGAVQLEWLDRLLGRS